jgi:hypothetical protein
MEMKTLAPPIADRFPRSEHKIPKGLLAAGGLVLAAALVAAAVGVTGRATVNTQSGVDQTGPNGLTEFRRDERDEGASPIDDPSKAARHLEFMKWKEEHLGR